MNLRLLGCFSTALVLATACGRRSGGGGGGTGDLNDGSVIRPDAPSRPPSTSLTVSPSKRLRDLNSSEIMNVCAWVAGAAPGEVSCGDGVTVTYEPTAEECVSGFGDFPEGCNPTVGEMSACYTALWADACNDTLPSECTAALPCFSSTTV